MDGPTGPGVPLDPFAPAGEVPTVLALVFAMTFPTVMAWLYFLALGGGGGQANRAQQLAYAAGKGVQFAFPLLFLWWAGGGRLDWPAPQFRGLGLGLGFGLAVAAAMFALYFLVLRGSPWLAQTPARIRQKLQEFGADSPAAYLALALFLCVAHALLEEYYWRWFVFGRLHQLLPLAPAVLLASLAFMAHHVIVLHQFLPGKFLTAVLPLSLAVAAGGAVWCWLYWRTGSLMAPWLSHLLIDAALFAIGWDLLKSERVKE
jgi:membrane protease YdiL (CAAX protease family)